MKYKLVYTTTSSEILDVSNSSTDMISYGDEKMRGLNGGSSSILSLPNGKSNGTERTTTVSVSRFNVDTNKWELLSESSPVR